MKQPPKLPLLATRAAVQPQSFNAEARTVDLTWSTGATVRRFDFWEGPYLEELSMDPAAIRMDRLNAGAPVLANHASHDIGNVIGVVEKAWLSGNEGRATVRFSERADVAPILADIQSGILRNISVGYQVHAYDEIPPAEKGGMTTFRATDWEPVEVSVVAVPADASAQIRSAETLHPVHINMRNPAMSDPTISNPAEPMPATPAPVIDLAAVRAETLQLERARIAGIRETVRMARLPDTLADSLIESGKPLDECRADVMRQWSAAVDKTATPSHVEIVRDEADIRRARAVDALLARAGVLTGKEADAARQDNPYLHAKLYDLAKESADRSGYSLTGKDPMHIVRGAITQGTSDFPVILENVLHKTLLASYAAVADTWTQFCAVGSVSDFRDWKRIYTGTIGNLDTVSEMGEFTNKSIPDGKAEHISIATKGNLINISRQAIINDDLNYFTRLTTMLGRAAARTIEADVYALIAANPTMDDGFALFSSDHANYQASGAAISIASLVEGRVGMRSQMDPNGNDYLDIPPNLLLCPISKGTAARVVVNSEYDPDTANKLQRYNDARNMVGVLDTPRLSGNAWYLFADPQQEPVIEVAFLNGNRTPYLETEQGFEIDGVRYKVRLDYGVGAVGYRGAWKNAGA